MKQSFRPRLTLARPAKTRAVRSDAGSLALETIAAEFALLAQRRARIARQVDLLDRQMEATQAGLAQVTARMVRLAARMEMVDPALQALHPEPPPPPPPPPPPLTTSRVAAALRPRVIRHQRRSPFLA